MIRAAKVPFFQSRASAPLLLLTVLIMPAGVAIPYTRLGAVLGISPLPAAYVPWLMAILTGYCGLTPIVKQWFVRRYGSWP